MEEAILFPLLLLLCTLSNGVCGTKCRPNTIVTKPFGGIQYDESSLTSPRRCMWTFKFPNDTQSILIILLSRFKFVGSPNKEDAFLKLPNGEKVVSENQKSQVNRCKSYVKKNSTLRLCATQLAERYCGTSEITEIDEWPPTITGQVASNQRDGKRGGSYNDVQRVKFALTYMSIICPEISPEISTDSTTGSSDKRWIPSFFITTIVFSALSLALLIVAPIMIGLLLKKLKKTKREAESSEMRNSQKLKSYANKSYNEIAINVPNNASYYNSIPASNSDPLTNNNYVNTQMSNGNHTSNGNVVHVSAGSTKPELVDNILYQPGSDDECRETS